jgi:hypothetical protein
VLGGVSKIIMQVLNHTECIDTHKLLDVFDASDRKRVSCRGYKVGTEVERCSTGTRLCRVS